MDLRCFADVTIGFPAGAAARAKDDWHQSSTNWVIWSTGELRFDAVSSALFFTPASNTRSHVTSKPLGCLLKAVPMSSTAPGEAQTYVVTTNDPVHSLVRMGFRSIADEQTFCALAKAAEAKCGNSFFDGGRRSSVGRASMASAEGPQDELTAHIRQNHPDKWLAPVYSACELYGPDPRGDPGCEVLLGRGAVALLDPQDSRVVGTYELVFYDEGYPDALMRVPIGPRTRLTPQAQSEQMGRLSVASRRISSRPIGAGVTYDFSAQGTDLYAFSFDDETTAASFARDLTVRQRLAALSLKASRGQQAMMGLQGEISSLQTGGFFAFLRQIFTRVLILVTFLILLHGVTLYLAEPDKPIPDIAQSALSDALTVSSWLLSMARDASATVCHSLARSVAVADLERCTVLSSAEAKDCVIGLMAGSGPLGFTPF